MSRRPKQNAGRATYRPDHLSAYERNALEQEDHQWFRELSIKCSHYFHLSTDESKPNECVGVGALSVEYFLRFGLSHHMSVFWAENFLFKQLQISEKRKLWQISHLYWSNIYEWNLTSHHWSASYVRRIHRLDLGGWALLYLRQETGQIARSTEELDELHEISQKVQSCLSWVKPSHFLW